jgi:hypothetical protein
MWEEEKGKKNVKILKNVKIRKNHHEIRKNYHESHNVYKDYQTHKLNHQRISKRINSKHKKNKINKESLTFIIKL